MATITDRDSVEGSSVTSLAIPSFMPKAKVGKLISLRGSRDKIKEALSLLGRKEPDSATNSCCFLSEEDCKNLIEQNFFEG